MSPPVVFGSDDVSAFMSIGEEIVWMELSSGFAVQMVVFPDEIADVL